MKIRLPCVPNLRCMQLVGGRVIKSVELYAYVTGVSRAGCCVVKLMTGKDELRKGERKQRKPRGFAYPD